MKAEFITYHPDGWGEELLVVFQDDVEAPPSEEEERFRAHFGGGVDFREAAPGVLITVDRAGEQRRIPTAAEWFRHREAIITAIDRHYCEHR